MVLAIDFDGAIHDRSQRIDGRRLGAPIAGAQRTLERIRYEIGAKIVIYSVWGDEDGRDAIRDWLCFNDIPYDEVTNVKPNADIYLDDKAVRFTSWADFAAFVGLSARDDAE
jgi:hypothetical protein